MIVELIVLKGMETDLNLKFFIHIYIKIKYVFNNWQH